VPAAERTSSAGDQFWIWMGANIAPINWVLGTLGITLGLSLIETLVVIALGNALGCAIFGVFCVMGHRTGVNMRSLFMNMTALTPPAPSGSGSPEKEKPIVATVLLSDGANSTGAVEPIPAAEEAAALNVPIYTIALGTADGVVTVPDELGDLHTVNVPPDTETLAQIAETTGGRSFEAPSAKDLDAIYQSLGSKIGYTSQEQEVTQWFAAAGLLLVVAGAGLAAHWFNRFP
jgi:hypothetical protein